MRKSTLVILAIGLHHYSQAQITKDTVILETFTINGTRTADSTDRSVRQVSELRTEDINHFPQQSVQEVLQQGVGIDVRSRGPVGVQSDLSIRGGSFDQSLAMISGVKLTDPQTGHHMMDLPVLPDDISGVEQINNGGSRWFGPYAFSGSVNMLLREAENTGVEIGLTGGDYGYFNGSAHLNFVNHFSSSTITLGQSSSDGYQPNTDFKNEVASIRTALKLGKHRLNIFAGEIDKSFGAQNFYTVNYPYQHEETKTLLSFVQGQLQFGRFHVKPTLAFRQHNDRFDLYRIDGDYYHSSGDYFVMGEDTVPSWYSGPNYHQTTTASAGVSVSYYSFFGTSHIGGEYRAEEIYSNNLGELLDEPVDGPGNAVFTKHGQRFNRSIYIEQNKVLGPVGLSAGVLINDHSDFGRAYFPGADVSVKIVKHLQVFGGINYNTRFPTYTDLYYNLGGAVGSIDLRPETSLNYQAGMKHNNKSANFTVTAFIRDGKNLIDWIREDGSATTQAANLTAVKFQGLECEGGLNLKEISPSSPFTAITARATFLRADKSSAGFESNYVLDYLKYKVFLGLHHEIVAGFKARWSLRYQDREGGYTRRGALEETAYDPYALVDFRLYQDKGILGWYVECSNLFDKKYMEIGGVQQAGRWIRLGLQCKVDFIGNKKKGLE